MVKYVTIVGKKYRIVSETRKTGLRRRKVRGFRLQEYHKNRWVNVSFGWKPTMAKMNEYISNMRYNLTH